MRCFCIPVFSFFVACSLAPFSLPLSAQTLSTQSASTQSAPLDDARVLGTVRESGVYVSPSLSSSAPPEKIAAALRETASPFRIRAMIIPAAWLRGEDIEAFAEKVRLLPEYSENENIGGHVAIIVAGRDIVLAAPDLNNEERAAIIQRAARIFDSESYAAGIAHIGREIVARRAAAQSQKENAIALLVLLVSSAMYWAYRHRRRRLRGQWRDAKATLSTQAAALRSEIEALQSDYEYALLGEDDAERLSQLNAWLNAPANALHKAARRIEGAHSVADCKAAETDLHNARREYARARNVLRFDPPTDAESEPNAVVEVPPLGSDLPNARRGYALDFFTAQPVLRREMAAVDLEVSGQRRRVWASRDSAARVLAGEILIHTQLYGTSRRAWFDVPHFNPWTPRAELMEEKRIADEEAEELVQEDAEETPISEDENAPAQERENEVDEALSLRQLVKAMNAQGQKLGACYIGFGRGENGFFAPDYRGWNGVGNAAEYSEKAEKEKTKENFPAADSPRDSTNAQIIRAA